MKNSSMTQTKVLMTMFNKHTIEQKANKIIKQYAESDYGIHNVFSLIRSMNIDLIRYPFDNERPAGFACRLAGRSIIVTNSSLILSREIFTAAHELAHILFDFNDVDNIMVDIDNEHDNSKVEKRAFHFADCLLMPETHLIDFIKNELEKDAKSLDALDIVRMQKVFNVSYSALVWRLLKLNMINEPHKDTLLESQSVLKSVTLFDLLGFEKTLLIPYGKTQVPEKYIDYVISNYENGFIPERSLDKVMSLMNLDETVGQKVKENFKAKRQVE